jgi:hypothetical protein
MSTLLPSGTVSLSFEEKRAFIDNLEACLQSACMKFLVLALALGEQQALTLSANRAKRLDMIDHL